MNQGDLIHFILVRGDYLYFDVDHRFMIEEETCIQYAVVVDFKGKNKFFRNNRYGVTILLDGKLFVIERDLLEMRLIKCITVN